MGTKFENEFTIMRIENGILFIDYKPKLIVDITVAKKCVADRIKFTNGVSYPIVANVDNIKETQKDAKDYLATDEALVGITAGAFIVKSHFYRLIGSVFLSLYVNFNPNKPPAKLFANEEDAIKWASNFKS